MWEEMGGDVEAVETSTRKVILPKIRVMLKRNVR